MTDLAIFYYTNNLTPPKLLEATLKSAIDHSVKNNCELIITSHYPVLKNYEEVLLGSAKDKDDIDTATGKKYRSKLYEYIVKDLRIDAPSDKIKNYVVGRLAYRLESIFWQILFSCQKCSSDYILFMEDDCFYPSNYIETIRKYLIAHQYDLTHCSFAVSYLDSEGFFSIDNPGFFLSTCAGKKTILEAVLKQKLKLIAESKKTRFEPILSTQSKLVKDEYKEEIVIEKPLCIDVLLKNQVLDIKHQLNSTLSIPHNIRTRRSKTHPYWGEAQYFTDLINSIQVDEKDSKLWSHGTCLLGY